MPVTWVRVAVMPGVAKGARRQAWKPSAVSRMGRLAGEAADRREQLGGDANPFAHRALAVTVPAFARQPHALLLDHRRDECFNTFKIDLVPRERRGVDRDERLADAGGAAFLDEEAVGFEAVRRSRERDDEELDRER